MKLNGIDLSPLQRMIQNVERMTDGKIKLTFGREFRSQVKPYLSQNYGERISSFDSSSNGFIAVVKP